MLGYDTRLCCRTLWALEKKTKPTNNVRQQHQVIDHYIWEYFSYIECDEPTLAAPLANRSAPSTKWEINKCWPAVLLTVSQD